MSALDERLVEQSSRLFDKFAKALTQVQPTHVGLGVLGALAPFAVTSMMAEVSHQAALLEQGQAVLDAYLAQQPETTLGTITEALKGNLDSKSLSRMVDMTVAIATLPVAAGFGTYLSQQFVNIKSELSRLKQENSLLHQGIIPTKLEGGGSTETANELRRGASRVDPEHLEAVHALRRGKLADQFERGIQALEGSRHGEPTPKYKGPGL